MLSSAHEIARAPELAPAPLFIPSLPTLDPTLLAPSLLPARPARWPP